MLLFCCFCSAGIRQLRRAADILHHAQDGGGRREAGDRETGRRKPDVVPEVSGRNELRFRFHEARAGRHQRELRKKPPADNSGPRDGDQLEPRVRTSVNFKSSRTQTSESTKRRIFPNQSQNG